MAKLATVAVPLLLKRIIVLRRRSARARRFAAIMGEWADAGRSNQRALFTLHVGQSAVIALGVAAIMVLAGQAVLARTMSAGDLVLINAYALQVCLPLNALDFVYREARDAWVNALDVDSEHAITREPDRLSQNRSTPVIAHRLSTIVNAHAFVVMDRGRIVEQGTHAELLRRKATYARLWLLQRRLDKEGER